MTDQGSELNKRLDQLRHELVSATGSTVSPDGEVADLLANIDTALLSTDANSGHDANTRHLPAATGRSSQSKSRIAIGAIAASLFLLVAAAIYTRGGDRDPNVLAANTPTDQTPSSVASLVDTGADDEADSPDPHQNTTSEPRVTSEPTATSEQPWERFESTDDWVECVATAIDRHFDLDAWPPERGLWHPPDIPDECGRPPLQSHSDIGVLFDFVGCVDRAEPCFLDVDIPEVIRCLQPTGGQVGAECLDLPEILEQFDQIRPNGVANIEDCSEGDGNRLCIRVEFRGAGVGEATVGSTGLLEIIVGSYGGAAEG